MNKSLRNLIIFTIPFLIMILVNETVRTKKNEKGYSYKGVFTMNSARQMEVKCSWSCHNNTAYCKANHVHLLKSYINITDHYYFGIIKTLKATGNYQIANIIFLMILWPLIMLVLLVKSIDLITKIKVLKKQKKHNDLSV